MIMIDWLVYSHDSGLIIILKKIYIHLCFCFRFFKTIEHLRTTSMFKKKRIISLTVAIYISVMKHLAPKFISFAKKFQHHRKTSVCRGQVGGVSRCSDHDHLLHFGQTVAPRYRILKAFQCIGFSNILADNIIRQLWRWLALYGVFCNTNFFIILV